MSTAALAMRRVGVAAIVGQSVATAAVDMCVTDEAEREARRQEQAAKAASIGSDPILSMGTVPIGRLFQRCRSLLCLPRCLPKCQRSDVYVCVCAQVQ
jgi:hypothetical protein